MPRPKKKVPEKKFHISGQDRVYLDGSYYYLGPSGSPEAEARYDALLAKYLANGRKMPADEPKHQAETVTTVAHVAAAFRKAIQTKYANSPDEGRRYANLCTELEDYFGDVPAADFGPVRLEELRDLFVASGNSRKYVNQQTRNVVRIFKHAVSRELIPVAVLESLKTLDPLRYGQTTAPEQNERQPVSLEDVKATAEYLSPVIKAMVIVQLGTGMRPSEVFAIRPGDIERSGGIWIYRPQRHKTMHKGKSRAVPIVGETRAALTPFLLRGSDEYCFSPKESYDWHQQQRSANRQTPKSCGNRPGTNRKENPKWEPGSQFRRDSYRNAIIRAAKKAGVPQWSPYRLRHTNLTFVREALGIEAVQALAGHSTRQMAEHYAKITEAKAIEAALAAPSIA